MNLRTKVGALALLFALSGIGFAIPNAAFAQADTGAPAGSVEGVVLAAAIGGGVVRTLIPWLRKKREEPEAKFDNKFIYMFVLAIVGSAAWSLGALPLLLTQVPTGASVLVVAAGAFTTAYTSNDILNEMAAT